MPHSVQHTANLHLHMHERERWRVQKLFLGYFSFSPLSLGWDSGYSHMRKQSVENLQYLKGPVLWHLLSLLSSDGWTRVFSISGTLLRLPSVLLRMNGTLLWLRVLHQWPLRRWSEAQLGMHSSWNCNGVRLMNGLMTSHYWSDDAVCSIPRGCHSFTFFSDIHTFFASLILYISTTWENKNSLLLCCYHCGPIPLPYLQKKEKKPTSA